MRCDTLSAYSVFIVFATVSLAREEFARIAIEYKDKNKNQTKETDSTQG